jgi:hypothetical protein
MVIALQYRNKAEQGRLGGVTGARRGFVGGRPVRGGLAVALLARARRSGSLRRLAWKEAADRAHRRARAGGSRDAAGASAADWAGLAGAGLRLSAACRLRGRLLPVRRDARGLRAVRASAARGRGKGQAISC